MLAAAQRRAEKENDEGVLSLILWVAAHSKATGADGSVLFEVSEMLDLLKRVSCAATHREESWNQASGGCQDRGESENLTCFLLMSVSCVAAVAISSPSSRRTE